MNHLIDVTPIPNWVLLFSKFLACCKCKLSLDSYHDCGITIQSYNGYFDFEIGHYLFELYAIKLVHFVIWAFLALLFAIQNYLLTFFVLLILYWFGFIPEIGVEDILGLIAILASSIFRTVVMGNTFAYVLHVQRLLVSIWFRNFGLTLLF
jgi:ABC-2 type transport system permease protein